MTSVLCTKSSDLELLNGETGKPRLERNPLTRSPDAQRVILQTALPPLGASWNCRIRRLANESLQVIYEIEFKKHVL